MVEEFSSRGFGKGEQARDVMDKGFSTVEDGEYMFCKDSAETNKRQELKTITWTINSQKLQFRRISLDIHQELCCIHQPVFYKITLQILTAIKNLVHVH